MNARTRPSLTELPDLMRGKVAVITGAAGGIGIAVSRLLGDMGVAVHLVDLPSSPLREQVAGLRASGLEAHGHSADVSDRDRVEAIVSEVLRRQGRVDILVVSAGIAGPITPSDEVTPELWRDILAVDLVGAHHVARAVARAMKAQGHGRIVVISSLAAYVPRTGRTAYGAAKAGLSAMARTMALELAAYGITVNAVCPGPVDTEFFRSSITDDTGLAERLRTIPTGQLISPVEVANVVTFLASPCAPSITGQSLHVNGGEFMT
jgi:NAD(P)-dependent dehydrogenase (short-subunit alcohol dehydrogenase family)